MDNDAIKSAANAAIDAKLAACEGFTTACISHPIIGQSIKDNLQAGMNADDAVKNRARHGAVKAVVEERFAADEMYGDDNGMQVAFITSQITAWPNDNKPINVRLFHPDDPTFDPQTFKATHLNLQQTIDEALSASTGTAPSAVAAKPTRPISMDDDDDIADTSMPSIKTTSGGHPVTSQCEVQKSHDTLNIPRVLVKAAGWTVGDEITVRAVGPTVFVRKVDSGKGDQRVDNEGRIRVHGDNVRALKTATKSLCTALVVEPVNGDGKYVQIQ